MARHLQLVAADGRRIDAALHRAINALGQVPEPILSARPEEPPPAASRRVDLASLIGSAPPRLTDGQRPAAGAYARLLWDGAPPLVAVQPVRRRPLRARRYLQIGPVS